MFDPGIVLAGFAVGTLVGLTGVGSGSLMAPFLIIVVGSRPLVAVGTDLAYAAVTKIAGGAQHLRLGTVERRLVLWLALGSVPGTIVGVVATAIVEAQSRGLADELVAHLLGFTLMWVAVLVLLEPLLGRGWRPPIPARKPLFVALGAVVGLLVGLTSLGSGAALGAALVLLTDLPYRRIVGSDVAHGAILTASAGALHFAFGHVDVPLTLSLLLGSLPGVLIGSRIAARLPEGALRPVLGVVLAVSGSRLI